MSVNIAAMALVFFGSILMKDSPLTAVQILWVNLIMDTLGALALATEPPLDEIMTREPYAKDEAIMNSVMWRNVVVSSMWQSIILGLLIFKGPGLLVDDYWEKCTSKKADGKCKLWNPFFTDSLYTNKKENDAWTKRGLNANQIDAPLLRK
jgi:magnesium-transporting ATPase (P-type)